MVGLTKLVAIALIGFGTQLIDGALGMAYGVTTTSLLLSYGIAPAVASASVHLAEIGTTSASALSHWRLGNVDWKTVGPLMLPGFVGAFAGAVALSSVDAEVAAPYVAGVLCLLGVYVLARFTVLDRPPALRGDGRRLPRKLLAPLGLAGGFLDAAGGGGWGPVCTPALLSTGRLEPRKVIGSVDTSEFVVAVGASAGFLTSLGSEKLDGAVIAGLLVGGVVAAPLAAWLVRLLPPRLLGSAVGGLIVMTNVDTITAAAGWDGQGRTLVYALVGAAWAAAVGTAIVRVRAEAQTA